MLNGTITSVSVLIAFSFFVPSALVPFHVCNYDENYKTTFEEKKFYAMILRRFFMRCSSVILKQIADLPSNPKGLLLASLPKACFFLRVCIAPTIHG